MVATGTESIRSLVSKLYDRDGTGSTWLRPLLTMPAREGVATVPDLGELTSPPKFDYQLNPHTSFLRWLIEHPDRLTSPPESEWKRLQPETRNKRRLLLDGDTGTREAAVAQAARGAQSLKAAWWRFEAALKADCALLTTSGVVLIESDPSRDSSTTETTWYPRPRLPRDLDCASAFAQQTNRPHVFVLALSDTPPTTVDRSALQAGLPHLSETEREELASRYLGHVSPAAVQARFGL